MGHLHYCNNRLLGPFPHVLLLLLMRLQGSLSEQQGQRDSLNVTAAWNQLLAPSAPRKKGLSATQPLPFLPQAAHNLIPLPAFFAP